MRGEVNMDRAKNPSEITIIFKIYALGAVTIIFSLVTWAVG
jgi:hypothetical protein